MRYSDAFLAIIAVIVAYALLVRALDADTQIPTEPDDPVLTLPQLIGDPCIPYPDKRGCE